VKRNLPPSLGFDTARFKSDLQTVCALRGASLNAMCRDLGICRSALNHMATRGSVPSGVNLAGMCRWAGLDAARYSVSLDGR